MQAALLIISVKIKQNAIQFQYFISQNIQECYGEYKVNRVTQREDIHEYMQMFTYTYLHIKIYIVEVYINCNTILIAPVFLY